MKSRMCKRKLLHKNEKCEEFELNVEIQTLINTKTITYLEAKKKSQAGLQF
jgi:hypothetical protein